MVLRPAWLPRRIRNASGNGGGVLVGYMPMVNFALRICTLSSMYYADYWYLGSFKPVIRWDRSICSLQERYLPEGFKNCSVEFSTPAFWLSHRTLRRRPTFAVAVLLEPPTHAQSVLCLTQSCMKFLGTSSCAPLTPCELHSRKLQTQRRKLKGSAFLSSTVFMIFPYVRAPPQVSICTDTLCAALSMGLPFFWSI